MELLIEKPIDNLLSRLPFDAKVQVTKFYDALDENEKSEFILRIGSYKTIKELQDNYQFEMQNAFSREIFLINPKGLGMGEVWIAWLVEGSVISGGGESFDVLLNDNKYEAKAYNFFPHYKTKKLQLGKYEGVWRLGNAGAMSNFKFMKHLCHAVDLAVKLSSVKMQSSPELTKALKIIEMIKKKSPKYGMSADFSRGEIGKNKIRLMFEVIDNLHKHVSNFKGDYDIVTFGSSAPGNPNTAFKIKPATPEQIAKGQIEIIEPVDESDISDPMILRRMLVKSKYIRDGVSSIIKDINIDLDKVEAKYENINFIIFRKSGMHVSDSIRRIEGTTLEDLNNAVGTVFNVSSASVRVHEK